MLAEFEPHFRPTIASFEELLHAGILHDFVIGLVGEIDAIFFVVEFALEIAFELVALISKLRFRRFVGVEFAEERLDLLAVEKVGENFVDGGVLGLFFVGFVDFKLSEVADDGFAEFVNGEHEDNFCQVDVVLIFGFHSDGEHLNAVNVFGDAFEAVTLDIPDLPAGANSIFERMAE